jgi:uroporphyrinogen-III decarboxylase
MEPQRLKDEFGGRIVFWGGGIDTQKTLPFGTPDDVRREVEERVGIFGPGGGFVFNAIHNVQYGTPPENLAAMLQTAYERGSYS